jgi:hypothetical protein
VRRVAEIVTRGVRLAALRRTTLRAEVARGQVL